MDTCVVIPKDLSLILKPQGTHSLEMGVTVWANRLLGPGTTFSADEGEVRLDTFEIYSRLRPKDVRYKFGCYDDIFDVDEQEVRHCNWVRFVQSSTDMAEVNMVATQVKGQFVFEVVKPVPPNGELRVFFDCDRVEHDEREEEEEEHVLVIKEERDEEEEDVDIEEQNVSSQTMESLQSESDSFQSPLSDRLMMTSQVTESMTSPDERALHYSPVSDVSVDSRCSNGSDYKAASNSSPDRSISHNGSSSAFSPPGLLSPDCDSSSPVSGSGEPRTPVLQSRAQALHCPTRRKEKSWLPCTVCGKNFDRPSLLKRHMRTHTGEKPHACDVCGKAFSTSSSLNTHRRIHSGEKPHQCQVCGKRFTASSNLYYHRMTHKKEKPHKCTMCSKSFPTPGDLKSHMYVHNGSWPFKCDVCNRGFSKQTNLKNHMLLHSGDKPHTCHICNKKFALQCNLRTHLKTHEDEQLDHCVRCKKPVTSKLLLYNGLCPDCGRSPQSRHISPFSVESLVSPRKDEVFKIASNLGSSPPSTELPRNPYFGGAVMAGSMIPMHPGSPAMNYGIGGHIWPQLAQRYRI